MSPLSLALAVLALAVLIASFTGNIFVAVLIVALGLGVALIIAGIALMAGGLARLCARR